MLSFYVAAILKQGRHGQFLAGKSTLLNSDACKKITLGTLQQRHQAADVATTVVDLPAKN